MNAEDESESLLALARAIAAGEPIAWDEEARRIGASDSSVVAALQGLHRIAIAHRDIKDSPAREFVRWAHLTIVERLRSDPHGIRYRARDALGAPVSLLLLGPMRGEALEVEQHLKDARLRTDVHHPNLATVFGADYAHDHVGMWAEDVPGPTMEDVVRVSGPLDGAEAVRILRDVCGAMSALHHAGLVHGDITPRAVIRGEDGRIVLVPSFPDTRRPPPHVADDIAALGTMLPYLTVGDLSRGSPASAEAIAPLVTSHSLAHGVSRDLMRIAKQARSRQSADQFAIAADLDRALQRAQRPRPGAEWLIGFAIAVLLAALVAWLTLSAG